MELEWATQRIINMYLTWRRQLVSLLKRLGMKSVTELVGRFDVIGHLDYLKQEELEGNWIYETEKHGRRNNKGPVPFPRGDRLVKQTGIEAEEGGCGVTGFACSIPVSGRHIFNPLCRCTTGKRERRRSCGCRPEPAKLGVDQKPLTTISSASRDP